MTDLRVRVSWERMSDLELEGIDDSGNVPESRIRDAAAARAVFQSMWEADRESARQRSRHQAMWDGEPPYDAAILAAAGQGSRTNVNWGGAANTMNGVMTGIVDLNVSTERLLKVPVEKMAVPDDEMRTHFENVLSEEITRTFRGWSGYNFNLLNLASNTYGHGVGIGYFDDPYDWRYKSTGLGRFVVPRQTEASEEKITVAGMRVPYQATDLYNKIRQPKAAAVRGWNVEAVKQVLINNTKTTTSAVASERLSWEDIQQMYKNNDIGMATGGKSPVVNILHLWVQEFDGTVSMYLVSEEAMKGKGEEDPFLFEKRSVYPEARNAFVLFTYGTGTNGTIHSISGVLRLIYPLEQQINRSQCGLVDAMAIGSSLIIQPENEGSMTRMQLTSYGPVSVAPAREHGTVIPFAPPNLAQQFMPLLADLRGTAARRAGNFQGDSPFMADSKERTRFEVQSEMASLGKVGATQINLWYPPWERLLREMTRRLCRVDYHKAAPGGKEAAEFRRRLLLRGFPLELLGAIDIEGIKAERAVGAGNGAARTATLTSLMMYAGGLDAVGRHNLNRDVFASSLGGYEVADRYIPRVEDIRPPADKGIANLENTVMGHGEQLPVEINQLHIVHLDTHLPYLGQLVGRVQNGEAELVDVTPALTALWQHCVDHLENIREDQTIQEQIGEYAQALNTAEEFVHNGQKEMARAQEEGQGAEEGGGLTPEMQQKFMEYQFRLQQMQREADLKAAIRQRESDQKMQLEQRRFEQQAAHRDAMTAGQMLTTSVQARQAREEQARAAEQKRRQMERDAEQKRRAMEQQQAKKKKANQ